MTEPFFADFSLVGSQQLLLAERTLEQKVFAKTGVFGGVGRR